MAYDEFDRALAQLMRANKPENIQRLGEQFQRAATTIQLLREDSARQSLFESRLTPETKALFAIKSGEVEEFLVLRDGCLVNLERNPDDIPLNEKCNMIHLLAGAAAFTTREMHERIMRCLNKLRGSSDRIIQEAVEESLKQRPPIV